MIFVDSSVFIAAFRPGDPDHSKAVALLAGAKKRGESFVTTDHVVDEVLTYLKRKVGRKTSYESGRMLLKSASISVEYASPPKCEAALELLGKMDGLSFCDALSAVVMEELGLRRIYSFDSDFDKLGRLERIE